MPKKQYVFALGEADSDNLYSAFFSRTRVIILGTLFTVIFLSLAGLLGFGMHKLRTNDLLNDLRNENAVLMESYDLLEVKTQLMESTLDELQKRNRQIRVAAAMPISDIEYGIGGPETSNNSRFIESSRINEANISLAKLEGEIEWLRLSTAELEDMLTTKAKQIAHFPSVRPVRGGWFSSGFGDRIDPFTGNTEDHPGIDISIKPGSEVFSSAAGIVKTVKNKYTKNKGYGKYVILDHGYGYETLYGHLSKIYVKPGQKVKRWDILGLTGNTGKSTAPHIHYGVLAKGKAQNPFNFILE